MKHVLDISIKFPLISLTSNISFQCYNQIMQWPWISRTRLMVLCKGRKKYAGNTLCQKNKLGIPRISAVHVTSSCQSNSAQKYIYIKRQASFLTPHNAYFQHAVLFLLCVA